jgi:tripartite motif-containing protein 71
MSIGNTFLAIAMVVGLRDWKSINPTPSAVFSSYGECPFAIALTKSGENLIVTNCDSHQVAIITLDGKLVRTIGTTRSKDVGQFSTPQSVAVDKNGNIWVADRGNNRLQVFTEQGDFVRSVDNLDSPYCVRFLSNGNVVVGGLTGELLTLTPDGQKLPSRRIRWSQDYAFVDIAVSPNDELFCAHPDLNSVFVYSINGEEIRSFGEKQGMRFPYGVTLTPDGYAIVTDRVTQTVSIWSPDGLPVVRFGSRGSEHGQFNFVGQSVILPDGRIAITDEANNRVQIF